MTSISFFSENLICILSNNLPTDPLGLLLSFGAAVAIWDVVSVIPYVGNIFIFDIFALMISSSETFAPPQSIKLKKLGAFISSFSNISNIEINIVGTKDIIETFDSFIKSNISRGLKLFII